MSLSVRLKLSVKRAKMPEVIKFKFNFMFNFRIFGGSYEHWGRVPFIRIATILRYKFQVGSFPYISISAAYLQTYARKLKLDLYTLQLNGCNKIARNVLI